MKSNTTYFEESILVPSNLVFKYSKFFAQQIFFSNLLVSENNSCVYENSKLKL